MAKIWVTNFSVAIFGMLWRLSKRETSSMFQSSNNKYYCLKIRASGIFRKYLLCSPKVARNFGYFKPHERPKSWYGDISKKNERLPWEIWIDEDKLPTSIFWSCPVFSDNDTFAKELLQATAWFVNQVPRRQRNFESVLEHASPLSSPFKSTGLGEWSHAPGNKCP